MPVSLEHIHDLLLPGLWMVASPYTPWEPAITAPHIWVPKLSIPQALAVGAVATIIKNPVITRRFWSGWKV